MLQAHPPKDPVHFCNYIQKILRNNAAAYVKEVYNRDSRLPKLDPAFPHRFQHLSSVLLNMEGGAVPAFHHLVWAKTKLLRLEDTWFISRNVVKVDEGSNTMLCEEVDETIQRLLQRQHNFRKPCQIRCASFPSYYDAAKARRNLFTEWIKVDDDKDLAAGYKCWHFYNERLMLMLNHHAWLETRHKVLVATGNVLPPELAEYILEYALASEGVPSKMEVRDPQTRRMQPEYSACKH
ncbi:hypothetical protein LTR17_002590 [Elasticomyces elasticus]|nr:hypothetical protein LTR17_002590 [Elasticomyces elasticus]